MIKLTDKQKRFVDTFVNNGGNGVETVVAAGYNCKNDNSARVLASENLKKQVFINTMLPVLAELLVLAVIQLF